MRRTSAALLLGLALAGAVVGWLLQVGLTAGGSPSFIPPFTSWTVLIVIAAVVLLLAWPVRRSVRRTGAKRVDPFFAMRVLTLAKAASITGALGTGLGAALVLYAVTRTGSTATPAFWPSALLGIGALLLAVAGLVAETWCRIPPEERAEPLETRPQAEPR